MNHPETNILYKYTTIARAVEILNTKKIFFPKPAMFNDPFDCNIVMDSLVRPEEMVEYTFRHYRAQGTSWINIKKALDEVLEADGSITPAMQENINGIAVEFEKSNSELGILALSEDHLSILMWSHYAAQHYGACVGMLRETGCALADDDITKRVEYSDLYPKANFSELSSGEAGLTKKLIFTKARDWFYEKEWRLLSDTGGMLKNLPGPIACVILGSRVSDSDEENVMTLCKTQGVEVRKIHMVPGKFQLRIDPIVK